MRNGGRIRSYDENQGHDGFISQYEGNGGGIV